MLLSLAARVHHKLMLLTCVKTMMVTHISGKSPVLSVDSGRKLIDREIKPTFIEMEEWLNAKVG
ncbi:hypothetical protein ACPSKX_10535 [Moritella viscosa]